jgi:hypothetical protein
MTRADMLPTCWPGAPGELGEGVLQADIFK